MSTDYELNGNIKTKLNVGDYTYRNDKPNAVKRINGICNQEFLCNSIQYIQYNGNNLPNTICQNKWQMNIDYSATNNRNHYELYEYQSNITGFEDESNNSQNPNPLSSTDPSWGSSNSAMSGTGALKKEKYYSGDYEEIILANGDVKKYCYIKGPFGVFAVNVSKNNNSIPVSQETYFIQKDHLGSFVALINGCGKIEEEYSYDAWGRRRNPYSWNTSNIKCKPLNVDLATGEWLGWDEQNGMDLWSTCILNQEIDYCSPDYGFIIDRGYIGQEHYDIFSLINLNARLYDPIIGRMLSPDPYVSDPSDHQQYNRYSYCANNPMKYKDPNGEFLFMALTAIFASQSFSAVAVPIIGEIEYSIITSGATAIKSGMTFWDGAWRGLLGGLITAPLAGIGGGDLLINLAWGAAEGAISGGVNSILWGNDFASGLLFGAASGIGFAAFSSAGEASLNFEENYGFRTNNGVIRNIIKKGKYDDAIMFIQKRYNLLIFNGNMKANMSYDPQFDKCSGGTACTVADGGLGYTCFSDDAFTNPAVLKGTVIHEYAHLALDAIRDINGNIGGWYFNDPIGLATYESLKGDNILTEDGPIGYSNTIRNSGKLNIPYGHIVKNRLFPEWNKETLFFHTIPRRFPSQIKISYY